MVEVIVNSVDEQVKRAERLADENTEAEFYLVMQDRDGVISVSLVEEHLRIAGNASRVERSALCDRVEASRHLGAAANPGTITEHVNN